MGRWIRCWCREEEAVELMKLVFSLAEFGGEMAERWPPRFPHHLLELAEGGGGEMVWADGGWWLDGMVESKMGRDAFHGQNGLLI